MDRPDSHPSPATPWGRRLDRRAWLRRALAATAAGLGGTAVGTLGNLLLAGQARAADYRALVCVFLNGGNDGMNTIVPTDAARHAQYAAVRGALALPVTSLVPLTGIDHGLHPALAALAPIWQAGRMAPVFNVGPLYRPLTQAQFLAANGAAPDVPDSLYSHSDQQVLWETAATDAQVTTGWGGRASDALPTTLPVISLAGNSRFGLSALQAPLVLPGPGGNFGAEGLQPADLAWAPVQARKTALDALYAADAVAAMGSDQATALGQIHRSAFAQAERLGPIVRRLPGDSGGQAQIDAAFASLITEGQLRGELAPQLYQVAKLVAANAQVGGSRQIFLVQLGGFDTHGDQVVNGNPVAGNHADLLAELGASLSAFDAAMQALGMGEQVTTFTQSDFGRTLAPNNSLGSDHAWGNHHLVLGGAVRGGRSYGVHPTLVLGGPDDVGTEEWDRQGRWIPTTSVSQYAATLLAWWGLADTQLAAVLPGLAAFGASRNLGFV